MLGNKKLSLILASFVFFLCPISKDASIQEEMTEGRDFIKDEMAWREQRDQQMRSPTSWLTIAGLFWLEEGENSFGTALKNTIQLPPGSAPPSAGKFILKSGKTTIIANTEVSIQVNGQKIEKMIMRGDDAGDPDIVALNDLRMWVIKRGSRLAIRLRDLNNPAYKNYKGLDYFPPSTKFKILADFVPYPSIKRFTVPTEIGTEVDMFSPGYIKFLINGQLFHLVAFQESTDDETLFIIFKDETNGKETYETSRFLRCRFLEKGIVDLNFNRAHNPPCAYTPYATCPLSPPQNWLKVRIEAGEKKYPQSHQGGFIP